MERGAKISIKSFFMEIIFFSVYTPNANMADASVVARGELQESEASEARMLCFDNTSPEKSCFIVDLLYFISLCLRVAVLHYEKG